MGLTWVLCLTDWEQYPQSSVQPPVLMDSKVHCWTSLESQCARWQAPASLNKFEQRLIVDGLDLGARPVVSGRKAGLRRRPHGRVVGDGAVGLRLSFRFRCFWSCSSDGDLGRVVLVLLELYGRSSGLGLLEACEGARRRSRPRAARVTSAIGPVLSSPPLAPRCRERPGCRRSERG